ncbi:hypothetical protein Syun_029593 [Stephania yunnanensis]|uniref:Uncharacterized protein n=1 Tax=Stephania yunnanensis TaxID=152371 RepID=A0AAP0E5V6_9MAGN
MARASSRHRHLHPPTGPRGSLSTPLAPHDPQSVEPRSLRSSPTSVATLIVAIPGMRRRAAALTRPLMWLLSMSATELLSLI